MAAGRNGLGRKMPYGLRAVALRTEPGAGRGIATRGVPPEVTGGGRRRS